MSEAGFEIVWLTTLRDIEQAGATSAPTSSLKPLLSEMYEQACRRPVDRNSLEQSIEELLRFLAAGEGRTHANCSVTSSFLMSGDEHWEEDWGDLPEDYVEILGIMGHELSQAVEDPEGCEEFGGQPEQLIEQLIRTKGKDGVSTSGAT